MVKLGRLQIAGLAAFPYLLGPLASDASLRAGQLAALVLLGVLFNAYGCTVNDLADARTDRLNPVRQRSPMVDGSTTRRFALVFAAVQALAIVALGSRLSTGRGVLVLTVFVLLLIASYGNVYQKRFGGLHPPAMDLLFGMFMAAPLLLASEIAGGRISAFLFLLTCAFALHAALLNALIGNLKDLAHDHSVRAKTSAILLGARQANQKGPVQVTRAYAIYVLALATIGNAALVGAVVGNAVDPPHLDAVVLITGMVVVRVSA